MSQFFCSVTKISSLAGRSRCQITRGRMVCDKAMGLSAKVPDEVTQQYFATGHQGRLSRSTNHAVAVVARQCRQQYLVRAQSCGLVTHLLSGHATSQLASRNDNRPHHIFHASYRRSFRLGNGRVRFEFQLDTSGALVSNRWREGEGNLAPPRFDPIFEMQVSFLDLAPLLFSPPSPTRCPVVYSPRHKGGDSELAPARTDGNEMFQKENRLVLSEFKLLNTSRAIHDHGQQRWR
ncbi:hypothetical protein J6590_024892 [Homalodisca vitripennis]|nr:hypothetical protein J6590_024892 [Homalodisca vitripennis]